jgi:hypothetical protein
MVTAISIHRKKIRTTAMNNISSLAVTIAGSQLSAAYLITFIHIIGIVIVTLLIFASNSPIYVYIGAALWVFIVAAHLFFDGCLAIRIERHLFQDNNWYGIWTPLFTFIESFDYMLSQKTRRKIFSIAGVIISILILLRIWFIQKMSIIYNNEQ